MVIAYLLGCYLQQAELNEMLQTYEEMALARCDLVEKIKESYEMYRAASNHQIRFHYINEVRCDKYYLAILFKS